MKFRVIAKAERVNGHCPIYKVGDKVVFEDFYLCSRGSANICLHALASMTSLLSPFLHDSSAVQIVTERKKIQVTRNALTLINHIRKVAQ